MKTNRHGIPSFGVLVSCLCMSLFLVAGLPSIAQAQLPQDVRDVFEGMLDSLDDDLTELFQAAIKNDTDKVEFTAEQFLRFRKHPANPFDGLDRIDVTPDSGNVSLKFELPSMRNRQLGPLERQHQALLRQLDAPLRSAAPSVVRVYSGKRHVAMGAIVDVDGLVVTKASEVSIRDGLACHLSTGEVLTASLVGENQEHDLAILKISASGLTPIQWSDQSPELGDFLLTPDIDGKAMQLGCYSVRPRSTMLGERAFLGVQPVTQQPGVAVFDIRPGTASYEAGLRNGDIILQLDQTRINDVPALVTAIRNHRPGDQVQLEYLRNGQRLETTATLKGNKISAERAARFKMMNRLGAVPSRRSDNFSLVFQHDTPLFPENCGGPVVNLDGQVVGLNIARKGRAASYALPAALVKSVVENLKQDRMAKAKLN